ncbi:MAG: hypothetical protein Q9P01_20320 [Anaerolineae bacterium]|nr:hypothetical protein [Anaerolineae bacterium]MDQ7037096.1 hypothetical protein [Anaerolineae bacterium]
MGFFIDKKLEIVDEGVRRYANLVTPDDGRAGASINQTENFSPSDSGTLVYFQADGLISEILGKITAAGGEIIIPKTDISPTENMGYYATFKDTEGNILGIFATS